MFIYLIGGLPHTQENYIYITVANIMEQGNWALPKETLTICRHIQTQNDINGLFLSYCLG